jgi:hypothetical protein
MQKRTFPISVVEQKTEFFNESGQEPLSPTSPRNNNNNYELTEVRILS